MHFQNFTYIQNKKFQHLSRNKSKYLPFSDSQTPKLVLRSDPLAENLQKIFSFVKVAQMSYRAFHFRSFRPAKEKRNEENNNNQNNNAARFQFQQLSTTEIKWICSRLHEKV